MDDRKAGLEERVEQLAATCEGLQRRLAAVEARLQRSHLDVRADAAEPASPMTTAERRAVRRADRVGALVGRSFVVLGGAFYLRALTDSGTLSRELGVGLGLAYAALWFVLADRHSLRGRRRSAALHCLTASFIAFPLIWEAVTGFGVLTTVLGVDLLMIFTGIGLAIAWRGGQASIAWTTLLFGLVLGLAFFVNLRAVGPVSVHLLLTSAGAVWVGHKHDWSGLAWPGAILVDALIAAMGVAVLIEPPPWLHAEEVFLAQLGLMGVFVTSFAVRHLVMEREATLFDGVQLLVAFVIGFEGAARFAAAQGLGIVFGIGGLMLALAAYIVTVRRVIRRQGRGPTYFLYTSFGAVALVNGLRFVSWGDAGPLLLAAAGILAIWVGSHLDRAIFRLHSAFFVVAAGALAGLWGAALDTFFGAGDGVWRPIELGAVVVTVGAAVAYALARRWRPEGAPSWSGAGPELVLLTVALLGLGGGIVQMLAWPLATAGVAAVDLGTLAVLRTAVLSAAIIALSVAARLTREWELRRLVTPLLVIGLAKLIVEDVPRGRPDTLFLSLFFLGAALIVATRTGRRSQRPDSEGASEEPTDVATEFPVGDRGEEPEEAEEGLAEPAPE